MRFLPLLLLLLAAAVRAQAPAPPLTHRVPVTVVYIRGSHWDYDAVAARVEKTREVLAQCGVRIDANIRELASPTGKPSVLYDRDRSEEPDGMGAWASALAQPRPTVFYLDEFQDKPEPGTSRPAFTSAGRPEVDTVWIAWSREAPAWQAHYHMDAHELVHVLADTGHSPLREPKPRARKEDPVDPADLDGGLMVENTALRTNTIAPALCEKIRSGPYARPL